MSQAPWPCSELSDNSCMITQEECLRLTARNKNCDMLGYYKLLVEIGEGTPEVSRHVRKKMLEPFTVQWRLHARKPLPGKKDMVARPLENELRSVLRTQLGPLGVSIPETGKKLLVWERVAIVADSLVEKSGLPTCILSFKTWLGEAQIRETFGYAYLAKTWRGQKDTRVYMVGLGSIYPRLAGLINACKPYVDGVYSLSGTPYLDDLVGQLKELYGRA